MTVRLPILCAMLLWACGCARPVAPTLPSPASWQALAPVSGYLLEDTLWQGEVLLDGDLMVPPGRTLTLRPGTTVFVVPSESTKIDPEWLSPETELLVRGSLIIEGSPERPVRFIPTSLPEGEKTAWAGIILDRARDFRIRGMELALAESGVLAISASGILEHSHISLCRYGVVLQGDASPIIRGNTLEGGEGGIFCWWGATPRLENNLIRDNEEEGLFIDGRSRPVLLGNRIVRNGIGIAAFERRFSPTEVQLADNDENLRPLAGRGGIP